MSIKTKNDYSGIAPSEYKELKWRYLCDAMEMVLTLGDLQKDPNQLYSPDEFCEITLGSINKIIEFEASTIYLVDPESSDLVKSASAPIEKEPFIEAEMNFLIDQGVIAWAIRENRGITVFSQDGSRQLLLHVIETYARIRGLFLGVFPSQIGHRPDGAGEFLSLMLRSAATSLESLEYVHLLNKKNDELHKEVDEKMKMLLRRERELANTRKLNAIASLAGGIAHEFNNMLTSLIGYNDLTKMDYENSRNVLRYAEKSSPTLERLASLTSQLLSYSRGGKYKTEFIPLKTMVEQVLDKLKSQFKGVVRVAVEFDDDHIGINCDTNQIRQVISAVIINAKEAIEVEGDIHIRSFQRTYMALPEQLRSKLKHGVYAILEIEDNGCGMDRKTRDRMFEPFFSTKFTGRGLSMAAVVGILENHQGTISVDSRLGKGTTVKIYLPQG